MQISLEKFSVFLAGIASLALVAGTGYLFFTIFFTGPEPDVVPVLTPANVSSFGPKFQQATAAIIDPSSKISLDKKKNFQFTTSALFLSFTEDPDQVLLSKVRGRENPFVPSYVAP